MAGSASHIAYSNSLFHPQKAKLIVPLTVTQMNGPVQSLENASQFLKFVMGL